MPLAFVVPLILVRYFTIEEFGNYKQIFLIFYLVIPVIDFGISNSLYYFLTKYPENKSGFLSQTFLFQILFCTLLIFIFYIFQAPIAVLFGEGTSLQKYIPYIGIYAALWHFSSIIEIILIIEKKTPISALIDFSFECLKSITSILVVILFAGGLFDLVIYSLILTGFLKTMLLLVYLHRKNITFFSKLDFSMVRIQVKYAVPFGVAVIVMAFVIKTHEYIISYCHGAAVFAVYSVGCFQLPFLHIISDSIAKVTMVRMTELTKESNNNAEIAAVLSNSIRLLWMIYFPIALFFFINAEDLIIGLFTELYKDSIPVFRVLIIMVPLSAILLRHVPRVYSRTDFILKNNLIRLILSVIFCFALNEYYGMLGVAVGHVLATIIWTLVYVKIAKDLVNVDIVAFIPMTPLFLISFFALLSGIINIGLLYVISYQPMINFFISAICYFGFTLVFLWGFGVLTPDEKNGILKILKRTLVLRTTG